jgi:hypothetical protein
MTLNYNFPHYYCNDGKIFVNKLDAVNYNIKNNQYKFFNYDKQVLFNYYDNVWSKCDWTKEPPESIDYYYKEQAQRIRDEYDYVMLCYSGGFDSTNILETFHFNNIKLDKIIVVGAFGQDKFNNDDTNFNGELYINAYPYLKELGLENITETHDYSNYCNDPKNFSLYEYGEQWVDIIGTRFSPAHWFFRDIEKYVVPPHMENKKVAIIFGRDKPHLMYDSTDNPGFFFRDNPVQDYGRLNERVNNIDRINFYWDPNYTNILIKQVHMLHQAYPKGYSDFKPLTHFPHQELYNSDKIVYNLRKPLLYKSPKNLTPYFSTKDSFLLKDKSGKLFDFYLNGIKSLKKKTDMEILKRPIRSKFYKITK